MYAEGRFGELAAYEAQYDRLRRNPDLDRAVSFHPEGNDVAAFYRSVDHILSPGDSENFHHALAEGVLSGCHPVVWPWQEAAAIYDPGWIVGSTEAAADRIIAFRRQTPRRACGGAGRKPRACLRPLWQGTGVLGTR